MKMNQEIKKLWVEKLPEYKQTYGQLKSEHSDKFCVLGVLCDLHAKETGNKWGMDDPEIPNSYFGHVTTLPLRVREWAGVDSKTRLVFNGIPQGLPYLNDNEGLNFETLAKMIEEQL